MAVNVIFMSKEQTTMLKGIAILMMLFLHLFSNLSFADGVTPLFWVGNLPFATVFARACNPVDFFLVCSGYGLAYAHLRSMLAFERQLRRVAKLYLNYWLILLLFVGVGSFVLPAYYPGDLRMIVDNVTGVNVDGYNHPAWFLLPYCMLILSSPIVFRVVDKIGLKWSLMGSLVLSYASMYAISRYIAPSGLHHEWYSLVLTYFDLAFAFMVGAAICYIHDRKGVTISLLKERQWLVRLLFVAWFAVHCLSGSAAVGPFFLCLFMLLFVNVEIKGTSRKVLIELGGKSMTMWLIHAFIYERFCHDFIYGFKYPLLIFLALVVSSYLLSIPIMRLSDMTIGRMTWISKKS